MEMHRQLFYHRDKWLTPQMKRFIDLVKEAWKKGVPLHKGYTFLFF